MTPDHPARLTARPLFFFVVLSVVVLVLVLAGPRLWAKGQVNLLGLELERVWTNDTLVPTRNACSPTIDADTVLLMKVRLQQASRYASQLALYQGAVACLQGDLQQAEAVWFAGASGHLSEDIISLFAAVAAYSDGRMLDTPYMDEIGNYAFKQCVRRDRGLHDTIAVSWCEFSFVYAPGKAIADRLAFLYGRIGEETDVQKMWLRLQEVVPSDSPDYWWAVGQVAELRGEWELAVRAYQRGEEVTEEPYDFLMRRGNVLEQLQRWKEAEGVYEQALRDRPDIPGPYLSLGTLHRKQADYVWALNWYRQAEALSHDHFTPAYLQGVTYYLLGDYNNARIYLEQAITVNPDHVDGNYYYAQTLYHLKEKEKAVIFLARAVSQSKDQTRHQWWMVQLGDWWLELGNQEEALAAYRQALEWMPDKEEIDRRIKEIIEKKK